jgi:hypothetical protein
MAGVWPLTLPQIPLRAGFTCKPRDSRVFSQFDVGPVAVRSRYSGEIVDYTIPLILTFAQRDTLDDFWLVGTLRGTDRFDWVDFFTNVATTGAPYMFTTRPQYTPISDALIACSFEIMSLP